MIEFPAGWSRSFGVDQVTAHPPGGGVRFRYHARLRPQPSLSGVVEIVLARDPEFRVREVGDMLRTVSVEGEYGAWVTLRGRRGGGPAARFVGATFLGDFAAALDCLVTAPARFAACEQLSRDFLHGDTFGMAARPRHYFYRPPPGWQGIPSGLGATWFPPDFPRNLTTIVVEPAARFAGDEESALAEALGAAATGELVSRAGVRGRVAASAARPAPDRDPIHREQVAFAVAPHLYRMRLESTSAERLAAMREAFHALATSFHPLPGEHERLGGRAFALPEAADHDHWVT